MRSVHLGYSNEMMPTGSAEGLGIKPGLMLISADYYGAFNYEDNTYVVMKVISDEYNRFPHLLNKFIVRESIYDLYVDGSGNLYLNQEETDITNMFERYLNSPEIKDKITGTPSMVPLFNGVYIPPKSYSLLELGPEEYYVSAVSILPEVFDRKKNELKRCRSNTFSDLQHQMTNPQDERIVIK